MVCAAQRGHVAALTRATCTLCNAVASTALCLGTTRVPGHARLGPV